jgi:DNA-binding winged helix-turn-helix (wHTH) protein
MSPASYRFLAAELQTARRVLRVDGRDCQIGARAFDLLLALIERRDRVVPKNELLELVWPRMVIEENNLPVQVSSLRKLLGANAIATVPGRGYQFVAPLLEAVDEGGAAIDDRADRATDDPGMASEPPPMGSAVFGRSDEVALLTALLESHRLVTVVGAGGIGKSRLARVVAAAAAERFRDGVSWIELSGLADPALLPHALAQPLGLSVPERDGTQTLVDALTRRQMLLVLDNCEHLLEPLAVLVERLLDAGPGCACWRRVRSRCACRPSNRSASSRSRCRATRRCRRRAASARSSSSSRAYARRRRGSSSPTPTCRSRSTSAGSSTACRSRSSSRRRAYRCSACARCTAACASASGC